MAKAMGIGLRNPGGQAMVTEESAQSGGGQGQSAMAAFQTDEQRGGVGGRPFQIQVFFQHAADFLWQRQDALLVSFAAHTDLQVGQLQVGELEGQDFTGAQAIQQHQADQGEIAEGTKAAPELGDLFGGEGHDHAAGLFESQSAGHGAAWPAVAERRSLRIGALEVGLAGRKFAAIVEAIDAVHDGQPSIHGCRGGRRLLIELIADIVEQGSFVDFRQSQWEQPLGTPAREVQQVIRVGAQGTERELADALGIEEGIGPGDLLAVLIEQAIGRHAGRNGRAIDQK